jgi:N-acetylglucosaminyl-diphospho-decaprenol L-rhamnosyltransferase
VAEPEETFAGDPLRDVAVVIVTYRSAPVIRHALAALPIDRLAACVVVDNASDDDTVAVVRGAGVNIQLVALGDNRGFGGGNNEGVRHAKPSRWLLFLNPDAAIDAENLETLIRYAERNPRVGIVAPRLRSNGSPITSAGRLATVRSEVRGLLPRPLARLFRDRRYDAAYAETGRVGYVEGACMLIEASCFRDIGGFDERFFLFFEEMDLAQRMTRLNKEAHLCCDAWAEHVVGASRATVPLSSHPALLTSTVKYLSKWRGARAVWAYRAAALTIWWLAGVTGRVDKQVLEQRRRALNAGLPTAS